MHAEIWFCKYICIYIHKLQITRRGGALDISKQLNKPACTLKKTSYKKTLIISLDVHKS